MVMKYRFDLGPFCRQPGEPGIKTENPPKVEGFTAGSGEERQPR
jgi:hypothetical protein